MHVPPYNTVAYSVSPTPLQIFGIPCNSLPEAYFSIPQQDISYVQPTTSYSCDTLKPYFFSTEQQANSVSTRLTAEQHIGPKNIGGNLT